MILLQQLANGVALGAIYALFAVGIALVFGVANALNLALATILAWGALTGLGVHTFLGWTGPEVVLVAVLAGGLLGLAVDQVALRPIRARKVDWELAPVVSTLGALIILRGLAQEVTHAQTRRMPDAVLAPLRSGTLEIFGIRLRVITIAVLVTCLVMMGGMAWMLRRSGIGRSILATSSDQTLAETLGIPSERIYGVVAVIGGAAAALAGVFIALQYNQVSKDMGDLFLLKGIVIVAIGGLSSLLGAVIAGIGLGIAEVLTAYYLGSAWRDVVTFCTLLAVLILRPEGLFTRRARLQT